MHKISSQPVGEKQFFFTITLLRSLFKFIDAATAAAGRFAVQHAAVTSPAAASAASACRSIRRGCSNAPSSPLLRANRGACARECSGVAARASTASWRPGDPPVPSVLSCGLWWAALNRQRRPATPNPCQARQLEGWIRVSNGNTGSESATATRLGWRLASESEPGSRRRPATLPSRPPSPPRHRS